MRKLAILVSFFLIAGTVLAGQTVIQKGNIITDVFSATSLFVERISGHQLKGDIDASGNIIKNLADPENKQDAATKAYVDSLAGAGGIACDGITDSTHDGVNVMCDIKEVFNRPKKDGMMLISTTDTAKQWCVEEGYNDGEAIETSIVSASVHQTTDCPGWTPICYKISTKKGKVYDSSEGKWKTRVASCNSASWDALCDSITVILKIGCK